MGESLTMQMYATQCQFQKNHVLETQFDEDPDLNFFDIKCIHHDFLGQWKMNDVFGIHGHDSFYHDVPRSDIFSMIVMLMINIVMMLMIFHTVTT